MFFMKFFYYFALTIMVLSFFSCGSKPVPGLVAEEDSLCIDTVATLDEVVPDTLEADSLAEDTL
jgi:hypothetical protein